MAIWDIGIARTVVCGTIIEVEADTEEEARAQALDAAPGDDNFESNVEEVSYEVTSTTKLND